VVKDPESHALLAGLEPETVLEVEGLVAQSAQAPGGFELTEPALSVLSAPAGPPPVDLRPPRLQESLPLVLDHAPLALRHPRERAKFALSAAAAAGFRSVLDSLGFTEIQSPKIVASATESGANVFALDYFGREAYLAQSPQFYKQAMVGVFGRVYEVGPVFRAEPHETARHLAEYVSLDAEMGFVESQRTVMALAREAVWGMLEACAAEREALALLEVELPRVPAQIPVLHFHAAQELLEQALSEPVVGEPDLAPAHERWLSEWARREQGSDFLFVEGYPLRKRPFYTHPETDGAFAAEGRQAFSNSFDLLFRGLELATGGQRLHLYPDYLEALRARGLDPADYEAYLEPFKHGMPPHGGFAIGLERFLARLVGAGNVRETTLFPRDRGRLEP